MKTKKIRIDLLPQDFDKNIDDQYFSNIDCPLARAVKRRFRKNASVGGTVHTWTGAPYHSSIINAWTIDLYNDWDKTIAKRVKKCYDQGDKTIYYVEIEKI